MVCHNVTNTKTLLMRETLFFSRKKYISPIDICFFVVTVVTKRKMALKANKINYLAVTKTVTKPSQLSQVELGKRGEIGILSQVVN